MKKNIILSAPTAKIQIGNQASITLDTSSTQGKKSFRIDIVTTNDSISKKIDDVVGEIESEIQNSISSSAIHDLRDKREEYLEKEIKLERIKSDSFRDSIDVLVPIVAFISVFGYLAFRSLQNRKWKESLLNKGVPFDEIEAKTSSKLNFIGSDKNDIMNYERQKTLKYSIVFGSLGMSFFIGTLMDDFGYFIGSLFLFLGAGFWYYNEKTNK